MPPPRIVSLVASATEIVHALELGDFQVGRSHECDYPPEVRRLPVCTQPRVDPAADAREIDRRVGGQVGRAESIYELHEDIVALLRPTHILTQTQCRVCAVSRAEVERAMGRRFLGQPQVVSLEPQSLNDIWNDIHRVADACGLTRSGDHVIYEANQRMRALARQARYGAGGSMLRVACLEWPEPLMAAGNWMPELIEMLGAMSVFGNTGHPSARVSWQQLVDNDPDVIILAPCGFGLARTRTELHRLEQRPEWRSLRAVRHDRVYLADGNHHFHRPGPRIEESLQILAEILYPKIFAPAFAGVAWELHNQGR